MERMMIWEMHMAFCCHHKDPLAFQISKKLNLKPDKTLRLLWKELCVKKMHWMLLKMEQTQFGFQTDLIKSPQQPLLQLEFFKTFQNKWNNRILILRFSLIQGLEEVLMWWSAWHWELMLLFWIDQLHGVSALVENQDLKICFACSMRKLNSPWLSLIASKSKISLMTK